MIAPAEGQRARSQSWLVYALGSGLGHVARAVSLASAAERRGHRVTVVGSSLQARRLPLDITWLPATRGKDALARATVEAVLGQPWDAVVVDTFPRGLLGELGPVLGQLDCSRVLVHRDVSPAYWEQAGLERFVQIYDLVLMPGERGPLREHRHVVLTDPWLIRDRDELLSRETARSRLGLEPGDGRPLVLVSASGTDKEMQAGGRLAGCLRAQFPRAIVRVASPDETPPVWPLIEVLPGVDVLVGAGGYNTVHEARCTGTPFVALPRPRLYDRQARRLLAEERSSDEADLIDRVGELLGAPGPRPAPVYRNGAHDAARAIEDLVASRSRLSPPPIS